MNEPTNFAQYLHWLIKVQKGMNYAEVAKKAGVSAGYLSLLANGSKPVPRPKKMEKIAQAIDCTDTEKSELMKFALDRVANQTKSIPHPQSIKVSQETTHNSSASSPKVQFEGIPAEHIKKLQEASTFTIKIKGEAEITYQIKPD